jgi:palmitoyltransferase
MMDWFDRSIGRFLDRFARVLGPILIVLACSLIFLCTYTFFAFVVPFHRLQNGLTGPGEILLSVTGVFFLCNTLFNYYMCVVVDAGTPPLKEDAMEDGRSALGNRLSGYRDTTGAASDDSSDDDNHSAKVCSKCSRIRSARTHHCSICNSCVVKMDHHCPWIYNCVGDGNYKFFYLFLLHLTLVDVFYVASAASPAKYALGEAEEVLPMAGKSWVILTVTLAVTMGVAVLGFLVFHTYLILTNSTTIEFLQSRGGGGQKHRSRGRFRRNPYDLGRSRNWQAVFGENSSFWTFKWAISPLHKGIRFDPQNDKIFPTIGDRRDVHPQE